MTHHTSGNGKGILWRRAERRDHASAVLPSDAGPREQQPLLPGAGGARGRRDADLLHRHTPIPVTRSQAGTCIMVELGNGKRFFFDFGFGCMRNIIVMAVPLETVNDIFFTHLHVDHYADLPYLYAFAPWMGRWKPLRVHGPSGRTPKDGIGHMIEGMKTTTHWHTDSFNAFPIGDGDEVEVNEFDHRDDNGICYDKDGVTVRHWQRLHTKDGASAYRLDWNGLSFVWTGDGRPDELSMELAQGVDVFVTEVQPDTGNLQALKFGMPPLMLNNTIDQAHSIHYAVGYMFDKIQPRLAMVTHVSFDEELVPEIVAGIRHHYSGLFQFGAPDVVVVNVNKDAVWTRKAVIPDAGNMSRPSPREAAQLFDLCPTNLQVRFPKPRHTIADTLDEDCLRPGDRPEGVLPNRICTASRNPISLRTSRSTSASWSPEGSPHAGEARGKAGSAAQVIDAIEQASERQRAHVISHALRGSSHGCDRRSCSRPFRSPC